MDEPLRRKEPAHLPRTNMFILKDFSGSRQKASKGGRLTSYTLPRFCRTPRKFSGVLLLSSGLLRLCISAGRVSFSDEGPLQQCHLDWLVLASPMSGVLYSW